MVIFDVNLLVVNVAKEDKGVVADEGHFGLEVGLAIVDVDVVVVVTVAVVFVGVVVLLSLVDADEKFSLVDVDFVVEVVDNGAMQVHFYVVTLVFDVVALFDAVFPMFLLWLWSRLAMSRPLFHSSCSMLSISCQMISSM